MDVRNENLLSGDMKRTCRGPMEVGAEGQDRMRRNRMGVWEETKMEERT